MYVAMAIVYIHKTINIAENIKDPGNDHHDLSYLWLPQCSIEKGLYDTIQGYIYIIVSDAKEKPFHKSCYNGSYEIFFIAFAYVSKKKSRKKAHRIPAIFSRIGINPKRNQSSCEFFCKKRFTVWLFRDTVDRTHWYSLSLSPSLYRVYKTFNVLFQSMLFHLVACTVFFLFIHQSPCSVH